MKLFFVEVQSQREKKELLLATVAFLYRRGERLLFLLPDEKAVAYLDQLLWAEPSSAFLPHAAARSLSLRQKRDERLLLTDEMGDNSNNATAAINLHPSPWEVDGEGRLVGALELLIELIDCTVQERAERGRGHLQFYRERGIDVELSRWPSLLTVI